MSHRFPIRIYYEDTDMAGIVYYANYLRYIERGRSEWLRELGIDQKTLKEQTGMVFAVRRVLADYLRPGFFDDALVVQSRCKDIRPARIVLDQAVLRGDETIFTAEVTLAMLGADGKAHAIPAEIRQKLVPDEL